MAAIALCPFPIHYFAPRPERATGQKLASTPAGHSVLAATTDVNGTQRTTSQRLAPMRHAAYGLPYEGFDHV